MTMAGLTSTGFEIKDAETIKNEIDASMRSTISSALNTQPDSVLGQINSIMATKFSELWELALAVYRAFHPDYAADEALDQIAAYTGVLRLEATKSTVTLTVNLNAGVTLPVGRLVSSSTTGVQFTTTAEATNASGSPANVTVAAESVDYGPISAPAGTLDTIDTPVSGWNSVTNALDAEPGRNIETDEELRIRRERLLRLAGTGTVDAIRADLLETDGVTSCKIFENTTMTTDGDGVPPKAFEALVLGGADADIAATIWANKPAGIEAYGDTTVIVEDSEGNDQSVSFSRPDTVDIHVAVTVQVQSDVFGGGVEASGVADVKAAIVAEGDALGIGDDVVRLRIQSAALDVAGVVDVTACTVDTVEPPVGVTNLTVGVRELALFDTSRVDVTVVPI